MKSSPLMEEIIGSSGNRDDGTMIQVPFPILCPHPPTDSETSTSATTAKTAARDADPQRCMDDDRSQAATTPSKRKRAPDDDGAHGEERRKRPHGPAAMATAASVPASLKIPPENIQPLSSQQQQGQSSSRSGNSDRQRTSLLDEEEVGINDLGFLSDGRAHDAADQIRRALHQYVAAVKRRKKRLEEEENKNKAWAVGDGKRGVECMAEASETTGTLGGGDGEPLSIKQRPIQVIMGWMDSFQDHEKIQLTCLQSLPTILESPPNRIAAQANGLASIVLYDMAAFPTNSLLQLTAFHTLVVLLRPLGTNEGTVHQMRGAPKAVSTTAAGGSGKGLGGVIRSTNHKHPPSPPHGRGSINALPSGREHPLLDAVHEPSWTENGVRVMLDSLRRFAADRYLQAMGCWAMVNAALYPTLKRSLLRLGGVYAVTNAMMLHPNVEAVQFRGLFALINLVIPDNQAKDKEYRVTNDGSSIHSHIYQIARLTIVAMKNFHANKSILNRGCIVLRNLSLTPAYVKILARTPGCVDMLLHCRQVCGTRDALVQRSARTIMILLQRAVADEKKAGGTGGGGDGSALPIDLGGSLVERPKLS